MEDDDLQRLYVWLDEIPLSRPKRNIARDFSDGVMIAEVVQHFLPKSVELHNYTPANSSKQKLLNWATLNRRGKVFSKLGLVVPENVTKGVVDMKTGVVEVVLSNLRQKIEQYILRGGDLEEDLAPVAAAPAPAPAAAAYAHAPSGFASKPVGGVANGGHAVPAAGAGAAGAKGGANMRSPPAKAAPVDTRGGAAHPAGAHAHHPDPAQALMEKDQTLMDYQETVDILQVKVRKLEQLVQLKDKRIEELTKKLKQAGVKL